MVTVESLNIDRFDLEKLFERLKLKKAEIYFMKITHETGNVFKVIVDKE